MTLKFLLDTSIVSAPIVKTPNRRVVRRVSRSYTGWVPHRPPDTPDIPDTAGRALVRWHRDGR